MLPVACDWTFLFPMRISAHLLLRHTSSSARRSSSRASSRRSLPYFARTTGSRRMAEEDRSVIPARENSHDSAARPLATAAASAAGSAGGGGGGVQQQDGERGGENSHYSAPRPLGTAAASVASSGGGGGVQQQDGERFRVSDAVNLVLHRGDITKWFVDGKTDAIVNAANSRMLGGGGVDGAIHRKAGPELKEACRDVPQVSTGVRCPVGEARITPGFDLPVAKVIHTVGPVYYNYENPADLLGNAYRNSLKAAIENGLKYVCFPAISCGVYSYPVAEAATVSLSVIKEASDGLSEVHFVMFEQETYLAWMEEASKKFAKI